ncbi:hypothetical protein [Nocardiopsis metallicus]|uniref:Uncharacterized protein n=1 Tax=Nocardiopsis metallicus TaxID=179819 RepID=A0A840WI71_9ACTN|nr:hypothetical protein [Nocardiopsis metallicus]MBB5492701.1 hypothetical protein [Nocardiopsis metallicus]
MNWAPRFPRFLSAPVVLSLLAPALLGAAAPAADDPPPEGPSHAYVKPAEVECDQGAGTLTVIGQLFPVLSQEVDDQPGLSLPLAAELAHEDPGEEGAEGGIDLELVLVPHPEPLPGITAEEMDEAADRAGTLTATLSGAGGRLLTGEEAPGVAWAGWEPPLGFYEVRVATESFSLPGFGDCTVNAETAVASVQVGDDDEQREQRENGAEEAAAASSGAQALLPWIILGAGLLGLVFLLVPAVLYLRRRRTC